MSDNEIQRNGVDEAPVETPTPDPVAELQAKADEHWAQYLRAAAELDNTRKRAARDVESAHRYALERIAADLAPVRDSLEMGLAAAGDDAGPLKDGVEMTLKQFDQALARHGIEVVDPAGAPFDPERHEAMQTVPTADAEPGTVVQVVQKGFVLNGRLVRPARVLVAREPDPA